MKIVPVPWPHRVGACTMDALPLGPITLHAAERWARAVCKTIDASEDPRTFERWGRQIGAAPGTIRGWCRVAHASPGKSLLLARALRGLHLAQQMGWDPENLFDIIDQRTLKKFLIRTGLPECGVRHIPTVDRYLAVQCLIRLPALCNALKSIIEPAHCRRSI